MSDNEIRKILAVRLRECRENAGLTIKDVGDSLGKSEKTISAWEHERGQPDADMLFKLCELYNIHDIGIFYGKSIEHVTKLACAFDTLTPDEDELVHLYRSVIEEGQRHILATARLVSGNPAMQKGAVAPAT